MKETKHTPGPWTLLEVGDRCKHLCPTKDGVSILTVALEYQDDDEGPHYFGAVHSQEDARLIAAAPDLLDALKNLVPRFERACIHAGSDAGFVKEATEMHRAAIAKAEGRKP